MKAKSIKGKSTEEINTALRESMSDGFKPTLAIVFISIKQDRKAVCEILHSKGIDIIGATSCGLFMNGYQDGYEGEGSAVILLLNLIEIITQYCMKISMIEVLAKPQLI